MSCAGNLPDHNKDLTVQGIHQGSNLVLPVVCADNWNDVTDHRNMDKCSEEEKKD
jgi:hypothetical protein